MVFLFPLAAFILAVVTVLFRGLSGADILLDGFFYFIDYILLLTLLFAGVLVVLSLFVDLKKPNTKFSRLYNNVIIFALRVALSACNVKVNVTGADKIPEGRFLLIQNHKAMFDPMVTVAYLGKHEIGFITKPENFHLPIINKFMHRICCIEIDRENARNAVKAINAASDNIMNDVCSMAIYPEGTRARDGEMLPFHAGSFKIATKSDVPIVITTVDNTNLVHRNAPFKKTVINLRICDVISAEEVAASSTSDLAHRAKELMHESLDV